MPQCCIPFDKRSSRYLAYYLLLLIVQVFQWVDGTTSVDAAFSLSGVILITNAALPAVIGLEDLADSTNYTMCMVAQDASSLRNRQPLLNRVAFTTLDSTPPQLRAVLTPGTDGDFTCDRCAACVAKAKSNEKFAMAQGKGARVVAHCVTVWLIYLSLFYTPATGPPAFAV